VYPARLFQLRARSAATLSNSTVEALNTPGGTAAQWSGGR